MTKFPLIRGGLLIGLAIFVGVVCAAASETRDALVALDEGNAALGRNDPDAAILSYSKAIRLRPNDSIGYIFRADVYNFKGNWTAAVADCNEALRIDPKKPRAYVVRALALQNLKKLDAAIADTNAAIRLEAHDADAFCLRGQILQQQGRLDDALTDYRRCIENDPKNSSPHYYRAGVYEIQGEYKLELQEMTEAVKLEPGSDLALNGLAWVLATTPDKEFRNGAKALKYAASACALTQWKNSAYLDTLAAAYAETGDFEEAVKWGRKALALAPPGEDATEARDHLKLYQAGQPYHSPEKAPKPHVKLSRLLGSA